MAWRQQQQERQQCCGQAHGTAVLDMSSKIALELTAVIDSCRAEQKPDQSCEV